MLMILGECKDNYRAADLMYNEHYLNHPRESSVWHFIIRKTDFSNMVVQKTTIVNEEKSADVIAYVTVNPHASSRLIAENGTPNICYKNFT